MNLWIPIVKPRADLTGLWIVPMDTLAAKDPAIAERVRNDGAVLFCPQHIAAQGVKVVTAYLDPQRKWTEAERADRRASSQAMVTEHEGHLRATNINFELDEVAYTPDCLPGDIIVARGDVLHRGQDTETQRVALSIRAVSGSQIVRKDKLLGLSEYARRRLSPKHFPLTAPQLAAFEHYGRDAITARELVDFMRALLAKDPDSMKLVASIKPRVPEILGLPDYDQSETMAGFTKLKKHSSRPRPRKSAPAVLLRHGLTTFARAAAMS